MTLEKINELMVLCELEQSILCLGKITPDEEGFFTSEIDRPRVKKFEDLQEKYMYGWYIAEQTIEEQIQSINDFKKFIIEREECKS